MGIDGGGTKTAFTIINNQGEILAFQREKGSYYMQIGFEEMHRVLKEGIDKTLTEAGCDFSQIAYTFLGLPAYGEKLEDMAELEEVVSKLLKNKKYYISNDVEASWAGTLACQAGINLVSGTGTIGYGRDQAGNTARASGWGEFCGDEGSAYWLGKKLISLFGKQADGRMRKTFLYNIVKENFGLKRDFDLITIIHDKLGKKRDEIAKLSLLLYQAASAGDIEALKVFDEAAYEISLTVIALINKLDFDKDKPVMVSYSGGVFKSGKYILEPLTKYLRNVNISLVEPVLEPVIGAALYALKIDNNNKVPDDIPLKLKKQEKKWL